MKNDFSSMGEGVLANHWLIKPAGKKVEPAKVHGSTSAFISCIPNFSCWNHAFYFQMHWFVYNTVQQKYQPSSTFMRLKDNGKRQQTGRTYSVYCYCFNVTKVVPDHCPVFQLHYLVHPLMSMLVLQVKEALHYPGKSLFSTETKYKCTR